MVEYVYRPSRVRNGKRVVSRLWSGAYSLAAGEAPRRVALHTPDKVVARAMLRKLIVEKQREREGILVPAAMREAASAALFSLVDGYRDDMTGRGLAPAHVKESISRIRRLFAAVKWSRLGDVKADAFTLWRSQLTCSAKTKKEFQTSANAFFNWLVRMGKTAVNPLAMVDRVQTRGKAVRKSRAFTQGEFSSLLHVALPYRRIVYLFLAYTGLRKAEARSLVWDSVDLGKGLLRVKGKGGRERVVPLRPELVVELEFWRSRVGRDGLGVFVPWPSDDVLHADLRRAGISRKDASGRVLHWHAFRKTFNTWAASSGVQLRSAQAVLGHSTPTLTANVYTDTDALPLRQEVAKLPWLGKRGDALGDAQGCASIATSSRFRALLSQLIGLAEVVVSEGEAKELGANSLAALGGRHPELFGANPGVFAGVSLGCAPDRSNRWSECGGSPDILAQRIRSIRFKNLHPNGLVLCPNDPRK